MSSPRVYRFFAWKSRTEDSLGSRVIGRYGYCAGFVFQKAWRNGGYLGMQNSIWLKSYRIFCFFMNNSVVLTHGFVKKSQKTPAGEIERAEAYRRDFLKRRV